MNDIRTGGMPRRLDGRNGEIAHRYYMLGESQYDIADALGISQQRVSQILTDIRKEIDETTRDDIRAGIAARMSQSRAMLARLAEREGAPVTAGKDGRIVHDEDGSVVRDYSLRVKALAEIRAVEDRLAKLYGADEPAKVKMDATVTGASDAANALALEAGADLEETG